MSDSWIVSCEIARSWDCWTVGYVKLDKIIQPFLYLLLLKSIKVRRRILKISCDDTGAGVTCKNKSQIGDCGSGENPSTLKSEKQRTKEQQQILWEKFDWTYLGPQDSSCLYRRMLDSWIISYEIVRSRDFRAIKHTKLNEIIQSLITFTRSGKMVMSNLIYSG